MYVQLLLLCEKMQHVAYCRLTNAKTPSALTVICGRQVAKFNVTYIIKFDHRDHASTHNKCPNHVRSDYKLLFFNFAINLIVITGPG